MSDFVIDASVVLKWIVPEADSHEALLLRRGFALSAPDLVMAECANGCWAKVRRKEMTTEEAILAARVIQQMDIELVSVRSLVEESTLLALRLAHPVYDCTYLALALERRCPFVTADERLVDKVKKSGEVRLAAMVQSLSQVAGPR